MHSGANNRTTRIILLIAVAAGMGLLVWRYRNGERQHSGDGGVGVTNRPVRRTEPPRVVSGMGESMRAQPSTNSSAATVLKMAAGRPTEVGRATLEELRRHIASLPTNAASREIREALDSRTDAPTGMEFKLAANGALAQAPTLRVFLLDQLAQVDPAAAAVYAEKILRSPDSADEWAVSMRSYALVRTDAESHLFLQQKFREMIAQDSWRSAPSVGFLEAFDVAVHAGGKELLPDLTALVRDKDNKAVAHAAYLALDRLTITDPATVLAELQRQPESMEGREATRANFFARADVGDPRQKAVVENYLLDPRLSPAELQTFAGLYPNANYMISQNLLTRTATPDHDRLAARDRQALETVNQWLAEPRFEKLKPQLEKIRQRLEMFVGQAAGGAQRVQ
jgi:hypothetical protein